MSNTSIPGGGVPYYFNPLGVPNPPLGVPKKGKTGDTGEKIEPLEKTRGAEYDLYNYSSSKNIKAKLNLPAVTFGVTQTGTDLYQGTYANYKGGKIPFNALYGSVSGLGARDLFKGTDLWTHAEVVAGSSMRLSGQPDTRQTTQYKGVLGFQNMSLSGLNMWVGVTGNVLDSSKADLSRHSVGPITGASFSLSDAPWIKGKLPPFLHINLGGELTFMYDTKKTQQKIEGFFRVAGAPVAPPWWFHSLALTGKAGTYEQVYNAKSLKTPYIAVALAADMGMLGKLDIGYEKGFGKGVSIYDFQRYKKEELSFGYGFSLPWNTDYDNMVGVEARLSMDAYQKTQPSLVGSDKYRLTVGLTLYLNSINTSR